MLFLKYANEFALPERRHRYIENAFYEFSEATRLKTTKTTYLLMAETILDYGHTPNGMTRVEAKKMAYEYIAEAKKREERVCKKKAETHPPQKKSVAEIYAQPTYMKDLNNKKATIQNLRNNPIQLLPNDLLVTQDELVDYDFTQLIIPRRLNADNLPVRNNPINMLGGPQEAYNIDGRHVRRQNVDGVDMRCFFNVMGFNVGGQMAQLALLANDPIVRYMIANEIVSSIANPDKIPAQVKHAINYDLYHTQRTELDVLENTRNILLREQNANEDHQNIQLLPQEYQNLGERGTEILNQLRRRALSLNTYNAFINHYIGNGQMMATLHDVQNNGNANLTSIDVAYLNNIGIKIFTPHQDEGLMLIHEYIPENAVEIAYIYHQGPHFQALIPVENIAMNDNNQNINENEFDENQADVEKENASELQLPSIEELRKKYPNVETNIKSRNYDPDIIRKILYIRKHFNKMQKEIGALFNIDDRKISEILTQHGVRTKNKTSDDINQKLLQAYLESYKDIEAKKIVQIDFERAFINKFNTDLESSINEKKLHYKLLRLLKKQNIDESIIKKETSKISTLYLKGKSFFEIRKETGLKLLTIIKILSENLSPKDYKNPVNLEINKKAMSEGEKEKLIIQTFHALKKKGKKDPSIAAVKNELEDYKISQQVCERILKKTI